MHESKNCYISPMNVLYMKVVSAVKSSAIYERLYMARERIMKGLLIHNAR